MVAVLAGARTRAALARDPTASRPTILLVLPQMIAEVVSTARSFADIPIFPGAATHLWCSNVAHFREKSDSIQREESRYSHESNTVRRSKALKKSARVIRPIWGVNPVARRTMRPRAFRILLILLSHARGSLWRADRTQALARSHVRLSKV